jgi:hypothetical protein
MPVKQEQQSASEVIGRYYKALVDEGVDERIIEVIVTDFAVRLHAFCDGDLENVR